MFLNLTGTEALFADLGYFSIRSIQVGIYAYACKMIFTAFQLQNMNRYVRTDKRKPHF